MTTMDATVSQYIAMRLARRAERAKAKTRVPVGIYQTLVRLALHIAGFAALTKAGFMWDMRAGFVVLGISCFLLSKLITSNPPAEETAIRPLRR